jgi:hypothetical protein
MRKMMVLATVVAAFAMVSQPTEARDRGFGFRQFSGHPVPKLHLRHPGFKFRHGSFVGKPRSSKSRHFGDFGHRGFAFRFGHAPHFKPRHFRRPELVLKFGDGDFVLRFGHVPHFKHRHFGRRQHHHALFFGLDPQFRPHRGFAFEDRLRIQAIAGAYRGSKAAIRLACPTARRQKPSWKSSRRWGFNTCQSCRAAGIAEDRPGSVA